MTYVIVKGTPDKVEFTFDDGGVCSAKWTGWGYEEVCDHHSSRALEDGNYYTGIGVGRWNSKKRFYVSQKWKELKDLIKSQLDSVGKVDIELPNYFSMTKDKSMEEVAKSLEDLANKVRKGKISLETMIKLLDYIN